MVPDEGLDDSVDVAVPFFGIGVAREDFFKTGGVEIRELRRFFRGVTVLEVDGLVDEYSMMD